jgi:hypothetical protein
MGIFSSRTLLHFFDFHLPPGYVLHDFLEDILRNVLRSGAPPENAEYALDH